MRVGTRIPGYEYPLARARGTRTGRVALAPGVSGLGGRRRDHLDGPPSGLVLSSARVREMRIDQLLLTVHVVAAAAWIGAAQEDANAAEDIAVQIAGRISIAWTKQRVTRAAQDAAASADAGSVLTMVVALDEVGIDQQLGAEQPIGKIVDDSHTQA